MRGPETAAAAERARPTALPGPRPAAVLFDRDGTLVVDVPYNRDPELVEPMPTALAAVRALRAAGIPVGVVSNQSGVARGLISPDELAAVNARVDAAFGGFDTWQVCPHGTEDGCGCRKPRAGLVLAAAQALGVEAADVVVVGDIGSDVGAAIAAGARSVLVPTAVTRAEEVRDAPVTAPTLLAAVEAVLATGAEPATGVPHAGDPRQTGVPGDAG